MLDMTRISLRIMMAVDSAMLTMEKLLRTQEKLSLLEQQIEVPHSPTGPKTRNLDHYYVLGELVQIMSITPKRQRKLTSRNSKITYGQNWISRYLSRS
jgi:hypothetical protein